MRAIDVHVHGPTHDWLQCMGHYVPALEQQFHVHYEPKSDEQLAEDFRSADVRAMMIAWDSETSAHSKGVITNEWVAGLTQRFPDVFLPGWAVVDPWKGQAAVKELAHAISELGLKGAKFMPLLQNFYVNDPVAYPLWDLCQSLGAPVLIHTGTTALGLGMPGGGGVKLKYGRPIPALDKIAADFPRLTIVAAHPAWPWEDEQIALLLHKANVYMDISGWRPRYIPDSIKREMKGRLQDKVLFGSDYPSLMPGQCLDELEAEGLSADVAEKLFFRNAQRVLNIPA
ncbi:MAG: amidohydrolase [Chloroflexi bacterium]|nr:amidohydrolase [Chloroflexota bacterium]